jgi:UDP-N-acetylmuramoylalanine--D-glutamate ligase
MQQMDPVQHAKALPMRPRLLGEDPELPQLDPEGAILLGEQVLLPADSPFARARALRENAALALAAVQQLGGDVHQAARALLDYPGLPHRLESLGKKRGVEFVDNGVSTVARTSEVAIESFAPERPVHWICGGHPKGPDLDAHVALAPRCASVHLFGEIAARLHAALLEAGHAARCTGPHEQMRDALRAACETASSGEIVLFSPAFSSHDAYANFAERAAEARELWAGFASE